MRRLSIVSGLVAAALLSQTSLAAPRWDRFNAILWHSDLPPVALAALPKLGITAGRVFGLRGTMDAAALQASVAVQRQAGLDTMIENIATDYYAAYHRYIPGQPINAAWLALLARYRAHPDDRAVWRREPGLADPAAFAPIDQRLTAHAKALAATPALYLSLGDETGIADLSAASDLDQGEPVLREWRAALRLRYGTIDALNRAWHTDASAWDTLMPTSTDAALDGTGPLAGWLDFKNAMDRVYARAVRRGTDAVHAGDPKALAAIEGGQRPGWGGYDYSTLTPATDVLEAGEPDPTYALARDANPAIKLLTTVVPATADANRMWHGLLLGGRGVVLWDEDGTIVRPDGSPGTAGVAFAAVLEGLQGPLGTALMAARPQPSPVAVLYSQASFEMRWLLDRRTERKAGQDWTTRDNDLDLADSPWRTALTGTVVALDELGLRPAFLADDGVTAEHLAGFKAILLPHSIVLSDQAVAALRQFAGAGGTLLTDSEPGLYDALGDLRPAPPLAGVGQRVAFDTAAIRGALNAPALVTSPDGEARNDVSVFVYDQGAMVAFQTDRSELTGPAAGVIAGHRCAIVLQPAVPTVLVSGPRGVEEVTVEGQRRAASCTTLSSPKQ